ncbi:MAG: apolipoprotein N-acyltransferase [Alphaproteobacteria bacterium]|nr:apolipoprotein N-acyltransferase [Alphaproteobacteria bacterium]
MNKIAELNKFAKLLKRDEEKEFSQVKRCALSAVSGILAVGALPPFYVLPCAFLAFSVLIFLLNRAENKKQAAFLGFWFGFGFFSVGLSWVCNAFLIEGMGLSFLIPLPLIGFGVWGGLFPATACVIAMSVPKGIRRLIALGAAWGFMEWVRSWFLTGFPWNPVASVWTNWPVMIQTASVWGAFGLSAVSVFIAGLPGVIKSRSWKDFWPLLVMVFMIAVLAGYGLKRLSGAPDTSDTINGTMIRLVQPNIPQGIKWNKQEAEQNLMKLVHLSRARGADQVSHVIWPETATQFLLQEDKFARGMVVSALRPGGILLAGSLRFERNDANEAVKLFNSIIALDDLGTSLGYYDKSHLVPFGEYIPFAKFFPFIRQIVPVPMDFSAGQGGKTRFISRTLPVGMLVCYEVIFPGRVADKKNRPYWLVNVTNDGWYGISAGPHQHFAAAQMRAVEEGLPLARSANTGISGMIDAYGRITAVLELGSPGYIDAGLPRRTENPTFYGSYGNIVPLIFFLVLMMIASVTLEGEDE